MAEQDTATSTEEPAAPAEAPTLVELQQAEDAKAAAAEDDKADDKDAAAEAAADGDDAGDGESDDPGDQAEDPKGLVKWFDETFGHKESGKYSDDVSFFRSVSEALRMVGRKGDAERLGEQIQERFADNPDALLSFLNGAAPKAGKAAPAAEEEFDNSWITTDDAGKVIAAPGAPADAMQRYTALQGRLQRFAANPEKFIQAAVEKRVSEIEQANQRSQQEAVYDKTMAAVTAWRDANPSFLYVEGDRANGLSPQGKQLMDHYAAHVEEEGEPKNPVAFLKRQTALIRAGAPKPSKRNVPAKATRKPAVATQPAPQRGTDQVQEHMEAQLAAGKSLADIFQAEAEMAQP